ncbi:MAG: hypothetical protein LBH59_09510 [Planctomycetaceae bacterium]|jgi:hypothetical protein|nr:hypothetical protein [Planctomycetaceae bacterium]
MPNWLTITWESDRLRLLTARVQGGSVVFERAAQFTLQKSEGGLSIKDQLCQFLQKNRIVKAETIVLLNRSEVEVRPMVFPPVPIDELCDLVRFQAVKEFNAYDQNSPLDFFVTNKFENISRSALFPSVFSSSGNGGGSSSSTTSNNNTKSQNSGGVPIHLLASTIRLELFQKISKFCEESGLNLRRILLRPCESAYLWKFSVGFDSTRTVLLLELDADETSQTVLYRGDPVFIRSPKISPPVDVSNPDFVTILAAELRRTMIAVRNEIQGITVDDVVVCGNDSNFLELSRLLSESLGVPVRTFDVWRDPKLLGSKLRASGNDLIKTSGKLHDQLTAGDLLYSDRYSGLIGSILRAGRNIQGDIDFCNPKRRRERVGYRVFANIIVAVVFLLLVGGVGYEFYVQDSLSKENKLLSNRRKKLEQTAKSVVPARLQLHAIEGWHADKIDWFEQLGWLSRNAPNSRDMMLTTLILSATQGGSMNFTSLVRDSSIVSPMEEKFRTDNHDVKTGEKSETRSNSQYRYQVTLWVYLTQSDWNLTPIEDAPLLDSSNKDLPKTEGNVVNKTNSTPVVNLPATQPRPTLPATQPNLPTPLVTPIPVTESSQPPEPPQDENQPPPNMNENLNEHEEELNGVNEPYENNEMNENMEEYEEEM